MTPLYAGAWLALALTCAALAAAIGALLARSLFAMCMLLGATGALAATAMLALGAADGALIVTLVVAVWTPVLLLAAMLLSARAAKPTRRGAPWLSLIAAAAATAGIVFVVPDLGPLSTARAAPTEVGPVGAWLAPLLLVVAAACAGLLGHGERGALERSAELDR